jgi:hypothetical protein
MWIEQKQDVVRRGLENLCDGLEHPKERQKHIPPALDRFIHDHHFRTNQQILSLANATNFEEGDAVVVGVYPE